MSGLNALYAVLMVGHSLFGTTGPTMLEQALLAGTGDAQVAAQIINGAPLRYNWEESDAAEGVDARAVLPEGGTTHLILTEAIPLENHTKWSETEVYAQAFANLAISANPSAKVYVQETWHSLKSGTGESVEHDEKAGTPWRERLEQDLPVWETIVAQIAAANRSDKATVALIPAGQAMGRLHDEIAAGRITGLSGIDALFADDIHLNDTGHYFVAMVQYAVVTGLDPLGLPVDFKDRFGKSFDTPDQDLSRELQRVAWEAVQAYGGATVAPVPPAPLARKVTAPAAPTGPPDRPVGELVKVPEGAVEGTNAVAIGLAGIADWGTQNPFLDLMKTARPWLGHKPGQFGGMEYDALLSGGFLDADGWPVKMPRSLSSIGTLILTDMPPEAVSLKGRYRLSFDGTGVIEVGGLAQNVRYGKGEVTFDYTPGPGSVDIRIQRINTTNPPRNIAVVHTDNIRRFERGAKFNPSWTARIGQFRALRFMDWSQTNDSKLSAWGDRPLVGDVTYATGVPLEVMIRLANELEMDAWFNMPHLADDDFVRAYATMVRDQLDPQLTAYVEFSNEVWNWQFEQARWADAMALERWGQKDKWMQFYGMRAAEVARIWTDVFADATDGRLVNVAASQTGWLGLETEILEAPLAVEDGAAAPKTAFDAYAVTGYFGGILGLEDRGPMVNAWLEESEAKAVADAQAQGLKGDAETRYVAQHRYDYASKLAGRELMDGAVSGNPADTLSDLLGRVWPYHAQVARSHNMDLVMYEGGSHVVGIGPQVDDAALTAFFQHFNYSAEMGALYGTLLEGWKAVGGQLFNVFNDVYAPTKWGSWGTLRHLDDSNSRWDAVLAFQ
ncbi:hypothetical protein Z946_3362 [Sulfitobacter noctilucicola]|uniref:Cellulose-binding protein n=1 Tax=Sulfitobacter noctilucicola TaxID=1342301 RepID=A0A7W6Q4M6_9RHOB|nr:hypothetical protein [Sulfitobacter noctilucicola]KIN64471.1 hypothetical protein Z946_3362 [Sulfitobacter noctilucicola]MBB4174369.1 hypothetical protein [Sulfitobacter noctilucicola]